MTSFGLKLSELGKMLDVEHLEFMPKMIWMANGSVWAQILAYKDARTDMEILDTCVGPANWQNDYKRDSKGFLQCGIGIHNPDLNEWIWKWSNGTPSNIEKEKGEYSDAFKRAGYLWGIGRSLYNFPKIKVQLNDFEYRVNDSGKAQATNYFRPNDWDWDVWIDEEQGIYEQVVALDSKANVRFNLEPHKQRYKNLENKINQ